MGTQRMPGRFESYQKAADDEPLFVLLGRDRHAPLLVRIWALLRRREGEDPAVIAEALACAQAMDEWRDEHHAGGRANPASEKLPSERIGAHGGHCR